MSSLSLSGENSWRDHWHGLHEKTRVRHFRLDLPLTEQEPRLDDADKMQDMERLVRLDSGSLKDISRALKAASFFFELSEPIHPIGSSYLCKGLILCRSPNSRALIQNLSAEYPSVHFATNTDISLGLLSATDLCSVCGRFQKAVSFEVRHPKEVIDFHLVFTKLFRSCLSGFPHSVEWFEEKQMIRTPFGRPDHSNPASTGLSCPCAAHCTSLDDPPSSRKRSYSLRSSGSRKKHRL
jgi:hypothetical protein